MKLFKKLAGARRSSPAKLSGLDFLEILCPWKSLKIHKIYPYTPRIDRGNAHFQIIKKIFTGLENTFVGTDGPENLRNGKNIIFYIETISQKFSQLRKKVENFFDRKFFQFFFDENFFAKNRTKNRKFRKSEIFDFWLVFSGENFRRKKNEIFFRPKKIPFVFRS